VRRDECGVRMEESVRMFSRGNLGSECCSPQLPPLTLHIDKKVPMLYGLQHIPFQTPHACQRLQQDHVCPCLAASPPVED